MSKLCAFILLLLGVVCVASGLFLTVGPVGLVAVGVVTVVFALLADDVKE